ncbi:unnamed protein product [Sphagnum jensenii]|uniref:Uncharacterized protein n=1 Tax=Sphagnum jensenii TaxID=128206 RepID=A0ABP0VMV3_9BRYO
MWMPLLVLVQQEVVDLFQSVVTAIAPSLVAEEGMCVCGEGLYKLTRHKSAVFEHDFRHYANSLNRTSSEVRALPMQLGLQAHDQKDCRKDVSGIGDTETLAGTVESQKLDNEELLSHSPSLKTGQLKKFVYKNYSLHGR